MVHHFGARFCSGATSLTSSFESLRRRFSTPSAPRYFFLELPDCGTITERGRCLYGRAIYCAEGALHTDECDGETQCGLDAEQRGFRCVKPKLDPCSGVDAVGACRDNVALSCRDEALLRTPCAPCGTCRVESRTGAPFCASSAE